MYIQCSSSVLLSSSIPRLSHDSKAAPRPLVNAYSHESLRSSSTTRRLGPKHHRPFLRTSRTRYTSEIIVDMPFRGRAVLLDELLLPFLISDSHFFLLGRLVFAEGIQLLSERGQFGRPWRMCGEAGCRHTFCGTI